MKGLLVYISYSRKSKVSSAFAESLQHVSVYPKVKFAVFLICMYTIII